MRAFQRVRNIKVVIITLVAVAVMLLVTKACQPPAYAGELELGATATQGESRTASYLLGLKHAVGPISVDSVIRVKCYYPTGRLLTQSS